MSDEQIKQMVKLFLSWPLPEDFYPDNGIHFNPFHKGLGGKPIRNVPVGTNLFTATQAEDMIRYLVEGSDLAAPTPLGNLSTANPPLLAPTNTDEGLQSHDNKKTLVDNELESDQALLLEKAYQLGYHKIKDGCLIPVIQDLNRLIALKQREELESFSDSHFQDGLWYYRQKIDDRIAELNRIIGGSDG